MSKVENPLQSREGKCTVDTRCKISQTWKWNFESRNWQRSSSIGCMLHTWMLVLCANYKLWMAEMRCACFVFNRRLIIWVCRGGWTKNGMARQFIRSCVEWRVLLCLYFSVNQCWEGWLEVCVCVY